MYRLGVPPKNVVVAVVSQDDPSVARPLKCQPVAFVNFRLPDAFGSSNSMNGEAVVVRICHEGLNASGNGALHLWGLLSQAPTKALRDLDWRKRHL